MYRRLIVLILVLSSTISFAQIANREINVEVDVKKSSIEVKSKINLPGNILDENNTVYFELNSNLIVNKVEGGKVKEVESTNSYVKRYKLVLKKEANNTFNLEYSGVIREDIKV